MTPHISIRIENTEVYVEIRKDPEGTFFGGFKSFSEIGKIQTKSIIFCPVRRNFQIALRPQKKKLASSTSQYWNSSVHFFKAHFFLNQSKSKNLQPHFGNQDYRQKSYYRAFFRPFKVKKGAVRARNM